MTDNDVVWEMPKIDPDLATVFKHTFGFTLSNVYDFHGFDAVKFDTKVQMPKNPPDDWVTDDTISTKDYVVKHYGKDGLDIVEAIFEHDKKYSNPPIEDYQTKKGEKYHVIVNESQSTKRLVKVKTSYRKGVFAAHKEWTYTITHLPTGLFVKQFIDLLRDSKLIVERLAEVEGVDTKKLTIETYKKLSKAVQKSHFN